MIEAEVVPYEKGQHHPVIFGQKLTPREREVIAQLLLGKSNAEIGAALFIEIRTIKTHLTRIFKKRGVRSRTQLVLLETKR